MELSTILMPRAFLPLACTANLAKNLAAVAASSTRAPIYRTFALQNNLVGMPAASRLPDYHKIMLVDLFLRHMGLGEVVEMAACGSPWGHGATKCLFYAGMVVDGPQA